MIKIPLNLPLLKGEMTNAACLHTYSVKPVISITNKISSVSNPAIFSHFGKGGLRGICLDFVTSLFYNRQKHTFITELPVYCTEYALSLSNHNYNK
jgi:hypothetical protein